MPYTIRQQGAFLPKESINNFGRTQTVTAKFPKTQEIARVEIDTVMAWTVTVDVTAATANTRVLAKVQYGAGNAVSTNVYDVSDHVDIPVVGDMVRLEIGLEPVLPPAEGGLPLPANAAAQVSGGVSADIPGFPWQVGYDVPPIGAGNAGYFGPFDPVTQLPVGAPTRLVSYRFFTTAAGTIYVLLFDQLAPVLGGESPVWSEPISVPFVAHDHTFRIPMPFAEACQWAVSSAPNIYNADPTIVQFFGTLTRRPAGQIVGSIAPSS